MRVSLFLAEGIQSQDGRLALPPCCHAQGGGSSGGGGSGGAAAPVGRVMFFGSGGQPRREERVPLAVLAVGCPLCKHT